MNTWASLLAVSLCCTLLLGCERQTAPVPMDTPPAPESEHRQAPTTAAQLNQLSEQLRQHTLTATTDLSQACQTLQQRVEAFLESPKDSGLAAAQAQWHTLHAAVHLTNLTLGMAESNPNLFAQLVRDIKYIHQTPIAPGFLDSVEGYPVSGLAHDVTLPIHRDTLLTQHGLTDDSEATIGLHVVEFLLYADDGQRTAQEYQQKHQSDGQLKVSELPQNRRRTLLELTTRLTCDSIEKLASHWQPASVTVSTYQRLPARSQLALWRNALSATIDAALDIDHCEFAPDGCQLTSDSVKQLLSFSSEHDLLPELNILALENQLNSLQNDPSLSATERQQHLKLALQKTSLAESSPAQK
ncbi:imelysin family protein [Gilvimarinus sp. 1_MG-2023]|uniref:imelysin family protein n=1 Tax=Gilvimarinus sp. 1_MG-2023 TaxID=3062638 RepID=UPI0026E37E55|nr:imelysin family protein [Gilvimarinus sp. 1_MG-2023]MDO6746374.1 imelysin family protein [Gilvimarinus sp. 1_MG-2023]